MNLTSHLVKVANWYDDAILGSTPGAAKALTVARDVVSGHQGADPVPDMAEIRSHALANAKAQAAAGQVAALQSPLGALKAHPALAAGLGVGGLGLGALAAKAMGGKKKKK